QGKEFSTEDVKQVLLNNYEVEEEVAARDAEAWIAKLAECNLI
ncbi:MAG: PqqD family peptide modification chaperone, partial [Alistipes sp.]|nr:PqqD family peptide modification chaperone [Alistipes sp.]